jgi:hypothetical protein
MAGRIIGRAVVNGKSISSAIASLLGRRLGGAPLSGARNGNNCAEGMSRIPAWSGVPPGLRPLRRSAFMAFYPRSCTDQSPLA